MKTVAVNFHAYQMSDELANTTLDMARDALKDQHAIYALIRGDYIEMTKYTYPSKKAMNMAARIYKGKGFEVKSVAGGPDE